MAEHFNHLQHPAAPLAIRSRGFRALTSPAPVASYHAGPRCLSKLPPRIRHRALSRLVRELKEQYKISVRNWRRQMSGAAYELQYADGRIKRLISAPRPRTPVSAAIFIHEVGHHAIGFNRYPSRCLEEYYVWQWTFREMLARHIPVTDRVLRHYHRSMQHYLRLARRKGEELSAPLHELQLA